MRKAVDCMSNCKTEVEFTILMVMNGDNKICSVSGGMLMQVLVTDYKIIHKICRQGIVGEFIKKFQFLELLDIIYFEKS